MFIPHSYLEKHCRLIFSTVDNQFGEKSYFEALVREVIDPSRNDGPLIHKDFQHMLSKESMDL